MLKFKKTITLNIVEEFDNVTDTVTSQVDEVFNEGEIVDAEIVYDNENGFLDIQFGDGSIATNVNKEFIEVV